MDALGALKRLMFTTRKAHRWSQQDVADALGYKSSTTIWNWEHPDKDLKVGHAQRHLGLFGIGSAEMLQKAVELVLDSPEPYSVAESTDQEDGNGDGPGQKCQNPECRSCRKHLSRAFRKLADDLDE